MIVSLESAREHVPDTVTDSELTRKIKSLESLVRNETHNNFQDRRIRFYANTLDGVIQSSSKFLRAGDSIEIGESINEGTYTVTEVSDTGITVDGDLFDENHNMITKVQYPADVQDGVISLLKWEYNHRDKVGIQSETIGRHAVTYFNMDAGNSKSGYPASLMEFLKPYQKMR